VINERALNLQNKILNLNPVNLFNVSHFHIHLAAKASEMSTKR